MLEIQNVSKTFNAGTVNEKTALNGLNLKLNEGDFVTVIGGNGAGKSTMLNAVAGGGGFFCPLTAGIHRGRSPSSRCRHKTSAPCRGR